MSASEASSFEKILIESNDQKRSVDLTGGIVSIDYYEDILSPTVTAKVRVIDTGNTEIDPKEKIRRGLYSGLPLRGGERIEIKIKERNKARDDKNYELADKIRDELLEKGVQIEDKDGKTAWKFK